MSPTKVIGRNGWVGLAFVTTTACVVLLTTALGLFAVPRAYAQVPSCGAGRRHFDPSEVPAVPVGAGRVLYVDAAGGSEGNDGLSEAGAFRTVGEATSVLAAGDTVRIKAGLYRERLSISRAGTVSARITIGAYGNGPVVIDTSTAVTGWTLVSGQIYKAPVAFAVTAVVVDDVALFPEFSQGALQAGRYFYDWEANELYLWVPSGGTPATHDVGVVADDAYTDGIQVNGADYLTLYGLTVRFAGGHGVSILGDGVRVEKCRLRFNGKAGLNVFGYGSTDSVGVQVIKNEVYFNVIRNWPRGRYKWGGWAMGVVSNGTPDILYQGNVVYRNGGEGMGAYGGSGGVIRDNVVYDNWSVNVYVDNRPNVVVENNFVYSHDPDPGDLYNNEDPDPSDNRNLRRLRGEGIMTADENYSLSPPANLANVTIANNVIVNCRRGINHYAAADGSGLKNVTVLHNTVVTGTPTADETDIIGIAIPYNDGNNTGSIYRDNIVYGSASSSWLLYASAIPSTADQFQGLTMDHNLWFHSGRSDPFHWGLDYHPLYDYTHGEWLGLAGTAQGAGDSVADPSLVNVGAIDDVETKRPQVGSPALGSGTPTSVTYDYDFCPRSATAPALGAFESATAPSPHPLTVANAGTGSGTVTSSPAGISCGADCTEIYGFGTVVTLTAASDAGSSFAGWSGACIGAGTCQVTMDAAQSVTATFDRITYTLTVAPTGAGGGTVTSSPAGIDCGADCSETYDSGTVVTLTAAATVGSSFAGWSGACTGAGTCQVTMDAAQSVTATFDRITYTLTVAPTGAGGGTVTSSPAGIGCGADCTETYDSGTVVTLTAAPAAGSSFAGWSGACTGAGTCQVTMDAAQSVTATFDRITYALTVANAGTGSGTVTSSGISCGADCSETYDSGTVVTLTAAATVGSSFAGWSGACTGAGTCQVTMDVAQSVTATFDRITYTLTVANAGTGSGTVTSSGISCGADCSETYDSGTVVTLTAAATVGSSFAGWSGACTGAGTCQVTMDAAKSVTATFDRITYALTVANAGTGSGTVTSSGIDCGADCSETYDSGTVVTLTAAATVGSSFAGWSGACTGAGTCQVTMDLAKSVTATFDRITYALTVANAGTGSGTVTSSGISCGADCSEPYDSGTVVTLTAAATVGSSFAGWSGACTGAGTCQVTMDAAQSVTATFDRITYTLTVANAGTGSGTVTSSPAGIGCGADCSETYDSGTVVTLTAAATVGSSFAGWSGACTGAGTCQVTMDAAQSVTATFDRITYTLTVANAGTGSGTVTSSGISCGADCSEPYDSGTVVTLTAAATVGSSFAGWSGACTGAGSCQVTMDLAKSVTATFDRITYALTVANAGTGSGTVTSSGISCGADCSEPYDSGTVVTLTAAATVGSSFAGWSGACTGAGTCQVTMDVAQSVTATFDRITYTLTVATTGAGGGTVTSSPAGIGCGVDCSEPYDSGTVVTLTAAATVGSSFAGWSGACTGAGTCQVTMDLAKSVTATFDRITYALTVANAGTGSGTVTSSGISCGADCSEPYDSGTVVTLTAAATVGSSFAGWSGACSGAGTCQVTMDVANSVTATFDRITYTLTVAPTGAGGGTVTSSPAGIGCGADCSETYDSGTVVTLTAAATVGSSFAGWSGACTGAGTCQVTMDVAQAVTATFAPIPVFTLTLALAGDGSGTVTSTPAGIDCGTDCSEVLAAGTPVSLTPTPASGSAFVEWSGACSGTGSCQITMDSSRSVTATFALAMYPLTVTTMGAGSGTVTSSPGGIDCGTDCSEAYNRETVVSLTAAPAAGSRFGGWSGACAGTGACRVTMDATRSVSARFSPLSVAGDFDGDGRPDLLWQHQVLRSHYVWFVVDGRMTSGAYLQPNRTLDRSWQVRGLGDLGGDTRTDLLWQNHKSGALAAWLMNGTRMVSAVPIAPLGLPAPSSLPPSPRRRETWQARGLADINGDGHDDVVWHHPQSGEVYVWFMNGTTPTTGAAVNPGPFADPNRVLRGFADFNGDGHTDLLWQQRNTGDLYVWLMNGTIVVGADYTNPGHPADGRWQLVRVLDLDGDGKADLLWQDQTNGELRAWYMNGLMATGTGSVDPVRPSEAAWKMAPQ